MSTDFTDIERVFNCDVSKGLALCNEYLCSKEFPTIELVRKHFRELSSCNLCMESWEKPTYAVHCITCSKDYSSCFCLNCFLNGKHKNHKAFIATSDQGNCDCGFDVIADPRYFCDKHQKMKISYKDLFTGEEIMKITNIVKLALKNITFLSSFDTRSTKLIFSYLQDLALLSTPVTDLIADLFIENFNVGQYTLDCGKFTKDSIEAYKKILGTLVNSISFKKYFTKSIIGVFAEFSNITVKLGSDPRYVIQFAPLSQFYQMQYTFFSCISRT